MSFFAILVDILVRFSNWIECLFLWWKAILDEIRLFFALFFLFTVLLILEEVVTLEFDDK